MNIYQEKIRFNIKQPMVRLLLNVTPSYRQEMLKYAISNKPKNKNIFSNKLAFGK